MLPLFPYQNTVDTENTKQTKTQQKKPKQTETKHKQKNQPKKTQTNNNDNNPTHELNLFKGSPNSFLVRK